MRNIVEVRDYLMLWLSNIKTLTSEDLDTKGTYQGGYSFCQEVLRELNLLVHLEEIRQLASKVLPQLAANLE